MIASGWATTVGVIGWHIGGGHGPIGNYAGLGVDNIVEAEIVVADGSVIQVTENNQNKDLLWALRGGGGSVWGIITNLVVRTHETPLNGLNYRTVNWDGGDMCG
mmetsp:Transcript_42755/g.65680  ORF Transcript_42755/g.65680 Transcript_42755/m.65680 type:complete len:104 (-) Transcript_42755:791-1102(-)|eukprot:CAMPEP_0117006602 /NCGR_PEP_ID=MMETSP0472-20121206/6771_1 /TAXON_ID=693140 ORGANISM="Tiarina fusus, Strain LIS" /NCGR_SAMPLE_ID=MMETSP0472 /ASSEMBLY_ACC=CAM_ASM_000603 /LENGTH=103 /DNA_ID=CAMNT_0004708113 /DNA_START=108 /DNA_END=419 /DNA_ORIENTATION=+